MTVGVRFTKGSAKRIASVVRAVEAFPIDLTPQRRRVRADSTTSSATMSYSDWVFGFSISGKVVTVNAGEVHHGKKAVRVVGGTSFTISADYQYIWVDYYLAGGGYLQGPSTVVPATDANIYRCWLHQFRLVNGVVSLYRIGHLGYIDIPGVYAN